MGKIAFEKDGQAARVVNKLLPMEEIDLQEYEIVGREVSFGLFSVAHKSEKKNREVSCTVTGMVPLSSYLSGIVTKKMFENTVSQIISIVKNCENSRLRISNLCLTLEHIFVDPRTNAVKCILWPLVNNQSACDVAAFFRELPYQLVFNKHEERTYIINYIQFFRTLSGPFSIQDFEQFCNGATANEPPKPSYDVPMQSVGEQKAAAGQRNICPNCGIVNAMGAKICVSCGTALIERGDEKRNVKSGTAVLGYSAGSTELTSEELPYPYLIRESTKQIISVDKPGFRIGKDKNSADFCVTDNTAVSRSHVVIHTREDRYFIVDQNSTNKTYIDGQVIPPNQEIEIFPGAKIKLANEEFVFYI
ncbi:FHA domain-containing protein [Clostridia bacterium OttesenSCG-928-F22]|nr:FHA domain-containing protein [Clostridia bacterium OttesenSCG-928-F22]